MYAVQKLDVVNPQACIKRHRIASLLRVDQAGEYGAVRIYQGQLSIISCEAKEKIQYMHEQECRHLDYFNQEIINRHTRPSLLQPLWHYGGYLMGVFTAWLGKESAMISTVAVEDVIEKHYAEQLLDLNDSEKELKKHIKQFRDEEIEHKDYALASGAALDTSQVNVINISALNLNLLYNIIKSISYAAIWVAQRL